MSFTLSQIAAGAFFYYVSREEEVATSWRKEMPTKIACIESLLEGRINGQPIGDSPLEVKLTAMRINNTLLSKMGEAILKKYSDFLFDWSSKDDDTLLSELKEILSEGVDQSELWQLLPEVLQRRFCGFEMRKKIDEARNEKLASFIFSDKDPLVLRDGKFFSNVSQLVNTPYLVRYVLRKMGPERERAQKRGILHAVAFSGSVELLEFLMQTMGKEEINAKDSDGVPPLYHVMGSYNVKEKLAVFVKYKDKVDFSMRDDRGRNMFFYIAQRGCAEASEPDVFESISSLMDGDHLLHETMDGDTLLHVSIRSDFRFAMFLIRRGDPWLINARDKEGQTALHRVVQSDRLFRWNIEDVIDALIEVKDKVNWCARDKKGKTALDYVRYSSVRKRIQQFYPK